MFQLPRLQPQHLALISLFFYPMQHLRPISEEQFNLLKLNLAKFCAGITFIQRREYARLAALMDLRISLDDPTDSFSEECTFSISSVESCLCGHNPVPACAALFEPHLVCTSDSFSRLTEPVNSAILFLANLSESTTHLPTPILRLFHSDFDTCDEHNLLNATFRFMCVLSVLSDFGEPLAFDQKSKLVSLIGTQNRINPPIANRIVDILSLRYNLFLNPYTCSRFLNSSQTFSDQFYLGISIVSSENADLFLTKSDGEHSPHNALYTLNY
jgi:hypothetical protein